MHLYIYFGREAQVLDNLKAKIKENHPAILRCYRFLALCHHQIVTFYKISKFKLFRNGRFVPNPDSNLIVSLTSYPARINEVWITIESIFQQSYRPWKVVLVLADSEFHGRIIPKSLENQVSRGLEIVWVDRNIRSYKKLLPTIERYPNSHIVTVDDDIIYEPWRLGRLVHAAEQHPGAIIGYRGWQIVVNNGQFAPYTSWPRADKNTPEGSTLLTGVGGILYPPGVLIPELLLNIETALALAPTADDIWFWAIAVMSHVNIVCLGYDKHLQIKYDYQDLALNALNCQGGANDIQLNAVSKKWQLLDALRYSN